VVRTRALRGRRVKGGGDELPASSDGGVTARSERNKDREITAYYSISSSYRED
jgi:hypothetical protein